MSMDNGEVDIFFDDLLDNTEYVFYVTIGNNLPYEPVMLYPDD